MESPRNLELFRRHRWEDTPLGAPESWPAAMRATVLTVLASGMPMATAWGPRRIQIYNDGYNAIYGDKHPAAFGAPAAQCWGEIWEFLGPAIDGIFEAGRTLSFESTLLPLSKHGRPEECYFDFSYSPVFDEHGKVLGFLSAAVETTERIVARRRQAVFDAISAARPASGGLVAYFDCVRDALAPNADDAASALLYRIDPISGRPDRLLWSLRADDRRNDALHDSIRKHRLEPGALVQPPEAIPCTTGDGSSACCLIPVHRRDGSPAALLVLVPGPLVPGGRSHLPFCETLSERLHTSLHDFEASDEQMRSLSHDLDEKEQLYQFLFENIVEGALYAAPSGAPGSSEIVLGANRQVCEMLGYEEREILGLTREQLVFDDGSTLSRAVRQRERSGVFVGELRFRHRDGHPVPVEVSSRLVSSRQGEARTVTLVRDISARKAQERLQLDQVRADTMAQMSAGVAHDFNNLLTVIVGGVDLLRARVEAGSVEAQVMAAMQQAADKAASLTRELLTFTGAHSERARRSDLSALVVETEQMLRGALGERVRLELRLSPELPHCEVDRTLFSTALLNLALNARDAMPEGGIVTISTDRIDATELVPGHGDPAGADRPHVRLTVADTGSGIPPELIDRVFDPFFTTKFAGEGSGLGLPMVQAFARKAGGFVRVASEPGRGARFEVLLPVADPAAPGHDGEVSSVHEASGQSVLVVEDNDLVREQAVRMLTEAGFRCVTAADGRAALATLSAGTPIDLVFTDVMMPGGMSGRRLADEIRRHRPDMPILLTTGYEAEAPAGSARDSRYETLPKPYAREELVAAVLRQLASADRPDGS